MKLSRYLSQLTNFELFLPIPFKYFLHIKNKKNDIFLGSMQVYGIINKEKLYKIKSLKTTYRFLERFLSLLKLKNYLEFLKNNDEPTGILFRDNLENKLFFLFENQQKTIGYDLVIHCENDKKINQQSLNVVQFFEKALGY